MAVVKNIQQGFLCKEGRGQKALTTLMDQVESILAQGCDCAIADHDRDLLLFGPLQLQWINDYVHMAVKIIDIYDMLPLQRLFGKQIGNIQPQPGVIRHGSKMAHYRQNYSLHPDQAPKINAHQSKPVNVSTRVLKVEEVQEKEAGDGRLRQTLTAYFDQAMDTMMKQQMRPDQRIQGNASSGDVTAGMRMVVIDWLVEVHLKFKMFPQTLFIVVAILDRYLGVRRVRKDQLQLFATAALFIGAKYEETYRVPEAQELVNISAGIFTRNELMKAEAEIIQALEFELVFVTPYHFLGPLTAILPADHKRYCLSLYVLELALLDGKLLSYPPSLLASSAIYLVAKIRKAQCPWPDIMVASSSYEEKELRNCAKELCQLLQGAQAMPSAKALRRKFGLPAFCEVARLKLERKDKPRC